MSEPTVRPLGEEDVAALLTLRWLAFDRWDEPDDPAVRRRMDARLPHARGAFQDGRLVASATWYPFEAYVAGRRVPTGALAGVVSAPEARRRGHVRALLASGLRELHERGVGWSLEYPFDPPFYARYGYEALPNGPLLDLPAARLPGPDGPLPDAERLEPEAVEAVAEVHAAFARRWSFSLARTWRPGGAAPSPQWRGVFDVVPGARAFAYRVEGAYLIAALDTRGEDVRLVVEDAGWHDAAARRRLWGLIGAWRGQAERVQVHLPASDPLARTEAPRYAVRRESVQARIASVPAALGALPLPPEGFGPDVTLGVHDDFCPWNEGAWRLQAGPDGVRVAPTRDAPEAALDVRALTALLAGTPAEVLCADGRAEGDVATLRRLAATTAGHPPFLAAADSF